MTQNCEFFKYFRLLQISLKFEFRVQRYSLKLRHYQEALFGSTYHNEGTSCKDLK